jgi:hypothetical protein
MATLLTPGLTPPGAESCASDDAGRLVEVLSSEPGPGDLPDLDSVDI